MKKYSWVVTLLSESSIPRITNHLLNNGYEISFLLSIDRVALIPEDKNLSPVLCINISSKETDDGKVHKFLLEALRSLEVPFYSSILADSAGISRVCLGYMPPRKPRNNPTLPPGPYRKEKKECEVIQFPQKDKK